MPAEDFLAAERFHVAQMWWIASELAYRNANVHLRETNPFDFYDGLEVRAEGADDFVFCNFNGAVHVLPGSQHTIIQPAEIFGAQSPHDIVKRIERLTGWLGAGGPSTTATLAYRAIAAVLTAKANSKARFLTTKLIDPGQLFNHGYDTALGGIEAHFTDRTPSALTGFWQVTANSHIVAVFSESGWLFLPRRKPYDLMAGYQKHRREFDDLSAAVLALINRAAHVNRQIRQHSGSIFD
ncbi:MAG: hypothetical protein BGO26_16585 [Actinobacteria bacterium 69-20]|nr:hypothetical protein [Actinomycetota bacterium]OJV27894.1 MAG: hypothetical protein BGO26_16585 [Actinobacteria bacterium 69-20]